MNNLFIEMNKLTEHFFTEAEKLANEHIEEDEYFLSWKAFHKKHPSVDKWEYEAKQKELQEV